VKHRAGRCSFAVVQGGRLRGGYHLDESHYSASLSKAMLLVAYLDRRAVRHRSLAPAEHGLLGPMIRFSDNAAASHVYGIVGAGGLRHVARRAHMKHLDPSFGWASTRMTARDQARFFSRIDLLVPKRHRGYAKALLSSITGYQRWGVGKAKPKRWNLYFKGGWRPERSGTWLTNQSALVKRGKVRIGLSVLCDGNPGFEYGTMTIEGVARRLLRGADRLRRL
jgi:hypothetical protein